MQKELIHLDAEQKFGDVYGRVEGRYVVMTQICEKENGTMIAHLAIPKKDFLKFAEKVIAEELKS